MPSRQEVPSKQVEPQQAKPLAPQHCWVLVLQLSTGLPNQPWHCAAALHAGMQCGRSPIVSQMYVPGECPHSPASLLGQDLTQMPA
jgi:hypothetical protein